MAEFDTGTDILRNVARRSGEILPTGTSTTNADHLLDIKSYINAAYWEICALKPWRWARKRVQFTSNAYVTGSVTNIVTDTVTLSANVTGSKAGYKFYLDNEGIPHRIEAHTTGTGTVTLETSYTGVLTSGTYTIFDDEITVASDILSFPVITELHWGDYVRIIPEAEMVQRFPRNIFGTERARYASFIDDSTIRLAPWTIAARLFECTYNYRPTALDFAGGATDTPIVPRDSRIIIALRALERIYADKRDVRLAVIKQESSEALSKMSSTEATFAKPRIWIPQGYRVSG